MSLSYWVIEGVGLCTEDIEPYINKKKLVEFMLEQLDSKDEEVISELKHMIATEDFSEFDLINYLYGYPFENLADILTHCDDFNSLTFGDDGDSGCSSHYLYYPPSMPWWIREEDPKSLDEVHNRIVAAVQKITDMDAEDILRLIDDNLFVVGCE